MPASISILPVEVRGQRWQLHPYKAAYWEEQKVLLLSDLHLGKSTHFRRAGIASPAAVETTNTERITELLTYFQPQRVLLLGDLFHSDYNAAWQDWCALVQRFHPIRFELVPGNHDILSTSHYQEAGLHLRPLHYQEGPFLFSHAPLTAKATAEAYNIAGHIHPGVQLHGLGRQRMRLPCFFFGKEGGILPAFGAFTGLAMVDVHQEDEVYGITKDAVIALKG